MFFHLDMYLWLLRTEMWNPKMFCIFTNHDHDDHGLPTPKIFTFLRSCKVFAGAVVTVFELAKTWSRALEKYFFSCFRTHLLKFVSSMYEKSILFSKHSRIRT